MNGEYITLKEFAHLKNSKTSPGQYLGPYLSVFRIRIDFNADLDEKKFYN
jgi:hypothetical protein